MAAVKPEESDHDAAAGQLDESGLQDEFLRGNASRQQQQDLDAGDVSFFGWLYYKLENLLSAEPSMRYWGLALVTIFSMMVSGVVWLQVVEDTEAYGFDPESRNSRYNLFSSFFFVFEVFSTGAFHTDMSDDVERCVFALIVFVGLVLFAVLVGFITESVGAFIDELSEGKSKVAESGHTLILGWNEATIRIVCQIAFIRRKLQMQNEGIVRRLCPWLRAGASSQVAESAIVILADNFANKAEMDAALDAGLQSRGIQKSRTSVGWDVICRKGNPTNLHDLHMVNATAATSILLTLTNEDQYEYDESDGKLCNSTSMKCLMALRHILYSDRTLQHWEDRRIVVQVQHKSNFMENMICAPNGQSVVHALDLRDFLNTLMFECAIKPGISRVLMELMNFEGTSFRSRPVCDMYATKDNILGGLIGLTFRDAKLKHCWAQSVLIGIVAPGQADSPGIVGDPTRVIRPDDLAIYVSQTSTPVVSDAVAAIVNTMEAEAKQTGMWADLKRKKLGCAGTFGPKEVKEPPAVLLCGWRSSWSSDPNRLRKRLKMIGCNARGGEVHITFLNQFSLEEFAPHFETIKAEKEADDKWVLKGRHRGNAYTIKLHHVQGDAVCEQDVETVLALRKFHVAIILGTQASKELTSKFEDSRVLHCCMLLRNLAPKGHHIRIVSENNVDQTSLMAIIPAPPDTGELAFDRTEPDFVNTQATFARALTLTLGYPGIGPAVNELFDEDNKKVEENALRNPEMDLLSAGELGITSQKLSFTAIQKIISDMFHSSDMGTVVALGYFQSAAVQEKLVLSPPSDEQRLWWKDDMIILICRRKKRHSTQGVSNIADTPLDVRRGGILGNLVGAVRASGSGEQSPRNVEQPAHCQSGVIDQACA